MTKSASRLTEIVKQRLSLQSEPVFSASIAGEQATFIVKDMLEDFMEEMGSKLQSAFEESDAIAGQLTIFCDLPDADRHAAAAAGQTAAAGQAAVDGSQPAPTEEKKPKRVPKPHSRMNSLGVQAANKWWPRKRLNGKLHLPSLLHHCPLTV